MTNRHAYTPRTPLAAHLPNLAILALTLLVAWALFVAPALAQAAVSLPNDTGTLVNIGGTLEAIRTVFVEVVVTLLFGLALVVARWLKTKWNIDAEAALRAIESKHRETLHWALSSGIAAALARAGVTNLAELSVDARNQAVADAVRWARDKGAPEAVAYFKAGADALNELALSKLANYLPSPAPTVNVTTPAA